MPPDESDPKKDHSERLDSHPEKEPDDGTLERMRQVTTSPTENPLEADLPSAELGQLVLHGEEMEAVLQTGNHRIREELKKRGVAKLAEVEGCESYGRAQILTGPGMKSFHSGANEQEAFYVGMDVRPDGASAYSGDYGGQVQSFGRTIEKDYPGYLVTWDGKSEQLDPRPV